nr:MAG TPA: hypothetical protein [Bacteriophage sp.]
MLRQLRKNKYLLPVIKSDYRYPRKIIGRGL